MERKKSKRGRVGEGPAYQVYPGNGRQDTEWRKDPEFSEAIERATAQRL